MKRVLGCGAVGLFSGLGFLAILAWAVWVHSGLVAREIRVDAAWSSLESVYQRRADLAPVVIEFLRGSPGVDPDALEALSRARGEAAQVIPTPELLTEPERFARFVQGQERLESAFARVRESARRVPTSGDTLTELESQLAAADRRLALERRRFDEAVVEYNRSIGRFPGSVVARIAGFEARASFPDGAGGDPAASPGL